METIYKKLSEFQAKAPSINKDGKVAFGKTKFNYATLENITNAVRHPLLDLGLMFFFTVLENEVVVNLASIEDDDLIQSSLKLPETNDPKIIGSNITYYKRYLLTSILGIVTDDDTSEVPKQQTKKTSLSEKAYGQAVEKIRGGDKGVIPKLKLYFNLTEGQENNLHLIEVSENE